MLTLLSLLAALPVRAAERIPFPPELQTEVDFWIRVYSEISTSEGFLHDQDDLGIVYRTLRFESDVEPRARRDAVDVERRKIEDMLKRLATGASDRTNDEKRIAAAFGTSGTPARYAQAAKNVRFQLGQSDRFRAGLERSSQWEAHIARTFSDAGLPPELAALPHVESSFDPSAYSKVGAAGLWQFMRGTGRRFLRIDDAVDERMDPFRATDAAVQLLDYNYRLLGTWPLALTAYNHGAAGMRRAVDKLGTTDIVKIIRNYQSRTFGFASRNFFASFLAALTIDQDHEKYFPNLKRRPELSFTEVEMPAYVPLSVLEKTLKVDHARLVELNPAFRPALLNGSRYVPKGYLLRLPSAVSDWTTARLTQQISLADQYINQPRARSYRVRKGDTLAGVAKRYGLSTAKLAQLNDMSANASLRTGHTVHLPELPATRVAALHAAAAADEPGASAAVQAAATPAPKAEVTQALAEQREEAAAIAHSDRDSEPVAATDAEEQGPSLVPGGAVASPTESTDYSVADDNTIRVAADETIGHYADWLGISASRVRQINNLRFGASLASGRKLKLDFSKVTPAQFEAKRSDYHEQLEAAFFANHRILGTQVYVVRRGDSLWNVASAHAAMPTWLVVHYNPDIDFAALRAGQQIVIPKIELLPAD